MEAAADIIDLENEEVERRHFHMILAAFAHYKKHTLRRVNKSKKFISSLPIRHRNRLDKYYACLDKIKWCIEQNDFIIQQIISVADDIFENIPCSNISPPKIDLNLINKEDETNGHNDCSDRAKNMDIVPEIEDIEKVNSILKLLVRDWSSVGAVERNQCYQPIIQEIVKNFPDPSNINVLVPGAGLGRLAFEIAMKGFRCQGNEFSLFMLFSSNFILNKCHRINGFKVYPWVHQFVNNLSCDHQVEEATFPDVDPSILGGADFSMIAGDFLKVYTTSDEWNCIATCFFIDCASNVIEFIETIYNILKPGGIWINLGPLLYHYSDMANQDSIEPPFDVLCDIITDVGFKFEKRETGVKTKYSQNPNSMLQYEYDSVFFVCKKPENSAPKYIPHNDY